MITYKIKIQYKGTNFHGWQIQNNSACRTIQGEITRAISIISKTSFDKIQIIGAGRTDAGVHSLGQIARVSLPVQLPSSAFLHGVNNLLGPEINIIDVEPSSLDFHPIRDSKWKEYKYIFSFDSPSPWFSDLMTFCSFDYDRSLLDLAASKFVGNHDFINYFCVGSEIITTVKDIYECNIEQKLNDGFFNNNYYVLTVKGSGFLKQMVRLIMGSIWAVAKGDCSIEQLEGSLIKKIPNKIGVVAPPQGLYMSNIQY
ncbi:MAG: tRNA pseudouridine(38-40) synthase TruA [Bdellovibrionales bacterium]|nr:tRNA pseudouridine(38-40) synthase TruA [Bdellovibrionales bacterium]